MKMDDESQFYLPDYHETEMGKLHLFVDDDAPHWIVTDKRGSGIINNIKQHRDIRNVIYTYAKDAGVDLAKAWMDVHTFIADLTRNHFLFPEPVSNPHYKGRSNHISINKLNELWIHTNNTCNLTCAHCLVDSTPDGDRGLSTDQITSAIDSAIALGTGRFYFTGGEPFLRSDIFDLIEYVCEEKAKELIILTNATLINEELIRRLDKFDKERLRIQVSLDGSTPQINDTIRGRGSFEKAVKGIENIVTNGFSPTVTTAITGTNVDDVPNITRLLGKLGVKTHHLLWIHQRGRATDNRNGVFVPIERLIDVTKNAKKVADEIAISIDNLDSYRFRANGIRGARYDLGNACYDSMCLFSNGDVYPSAAFAGHTDLKCGNIFDDSLENIWKNSSVAIAFRNATLQNKEKCRRCHLRFICGGGDIEHSLFYSKDDFRLNGNDFPPDSGIHAPDPYCELHKTLITETIFLLAEERMRMINKNTGFDAPVVLRSMGEGAIDCGAEKDPVDSSIDNRQSPIASHQPTVRTLHSNCVLSFDVDKPRKSVREFYGKAADDPQEELCCPTSNAREDTDHIPQDVIDRFYGCGSPIIQADLMQGESVVDLGSGAGIDCFIAAKKVGEEGNVIGIDMTDEMLRVANGSNKIVAENLGYDIVEFRQGFLEEIPVDDRSVDLITSNCVINLSPDKKSVFSEMWRILKDHGRIVISDIVSRDETPPYLRANRQLWGECISGALTEDEFVAYLEQIGFYGIQTLSKVFWKEVEGYPFYSVTVRGYKFEKKSGCVYTGQMAVYHGPMKAAMDEEGHMFPRNIPVEVCTDTAARLSNQPYNGQFSVIDQETDKAASAYECCSTATARTPCC